MLKAIYELPAETEQEKGILFGYWMRGVVAVDPETGAELWKSRGRRRSGRPSTYGVWADDGTTYIHYHYNYETKQREPHRSRSQDKVFGLSAYNDREAIEKANRRLQKAFEQFMSEVYRERVREEGIDF